MCAASSQAIRQLESYNDLAFMPKSKMHWQRFRIATVLFLMLSIAGYLTGYRRGYDSGVHQRFLDTISVVDYDIEFLLGNDYSVAGMRKSTNQLVDLIKTSCAPEFWAKDPSIPPAQIGLEVSPDFTRLKVTNYGHVQEQVEQVMKQLRALKEKVAAKPQRKTAALKPWRHS